MNHVEGGECYSLNAGRAIPVHHLDRAAPSGMLAPYPQESLATALTALAPKLPVMPHADVLGSTGLVQIEEGLAHERSQGAIRQLSGLVGAYTGWHRSGRCTRRLATC